VFPLAKPLPPNAVLLHIGPHKTGTTAIQTSLNAVKESLEVHGTCYLGTDRFREQAPLGLLGRAGRAGIRKPERGDWQALVDEVRRHADRRIVLSSERYCWALPPKIDTILNAPGRDGVHVVITLRPLDRILPSQWQMSVQGGLTTTYQHWLEEVFSTANEKPTLARMFWRRQAHGALVRRWSKAVGRKNVTAIVVDDSDKTMLPNAFASLLGLPEGLLVPVAGKSNRSLTQGEVELVRRVNEAFIQNQWSVLEHAQLVRGGLSTSLRNRQPESDEPRIVTPHWATELAADRADTAIAQIRASKVRVIGDLENLRVSREKPATEPSSDLSVSPEVGALAVIGVLEVERETRVPTAGGFLSKRPVGRQLELESVNGRDLVLAVIRRVRRRLLKRRQTS
jgi:hypothetical protein